MILFVVWFIWFAINTFVMLIAPNHIWGRLDPSGVYATASGFNGKVFISEGMQKLLTQDEIRAVCAHENGHLLHNHLIENYLVAIFLPFLLPFREKRRKEQEFEADDYAADVAGGLALASALRKISSNPFDIARAERLEHLAAINYYGFNYHG